MHPFIICNINHFKVMMNNKNYFKVFGMAALLTGSMMFVACGNDDPVTPAVDTTKTVTFENQTLNAQRFWCGDTSGEQRDNGYGGVSYGCTYTEHFATFNTTYSVSYWSGFAVSARTQTGFAQGEYLTPDDTPDQFNSVAGKAHTGNNYCVVTTYGETIDFSEPVQLKGLWYTNSAYTVEVIKNGNAYARKFGQTDFLTCNIIGTHADGTTTSTQVVLAADGDYVKDWQYCGLSVLGKVTKLSFQFIGSDSGDYGVNTPAYICIDDLERE